MTENHKFRLSDGSYKEAKDLRPGDSLHILNKFNASLKDIFPKCNSSSQDYTWLNNGFRYNKSEHRLIYEYHHGPIPKGSVVHHIDYNAQNNHISNLQCMTKKDHDKLHAQDMMGDKNPMRRAAHEWSDEKWAKYKSNMSKSTSGEANGRYSEYSHEDIRNAAITLCKKIGRRFSTKEWIEYAKINGLPQHFSKWRRKNLNGGVMGLSKWAAYELEFENIDCDPRLSRRLKQLMNMGYDVFIDKNGEMMINRECEKCENISVIKAYNRESSLCLSCSQKEMQARKNGFSSHEEFKESLRVKQINVFNDFKFANNRKPTKLEWISACKKAGVSCDNGKKNRNSPFNSFSSLVEAASNYNHRVVSVEECGREDVYNGTVDDFHNFYVGGWDSKKSAVYVNNRQCGEISLSVLSGYCVIADLAPYHLDDKDDFEETARLTARALIRTNLMNAIYKKEIIRTNRIGVGLTGIHEFAWKFFRLDFNDLINEEKSQEFWDLLKHVADAIDDECEKYSEEIGVSIPHTTRTVKPAGTTSKLFHLTEGIHLPPMKEYMRWVQFKNEDPLVDFYRKSGYPVKQLKIYNGMSIVGFPHEPEICKIGMGDRIVLADQATPEQQYQWLMLIEKYWLSGERGNQASYTLKYDPESVTLDQFRRTVAKYQPLVKCCSIMPKVDVTIYEYQPEQPISRKEFTKHLKNIKNKTEEDISMESLKCDSGACPL